MPKIAAEQLTTLRQQIDMVDAQIIDLLGERFRLTREIGSIKHQLKLASLTQDRLNHILARWQQLAEQRQLPPQLAQQLLLLIHEHVIDEHESIKTAQARIGLD